MKRLLARVRYHWFGIVADLWRAQGCRARRCRAMMQARRFHQLELKALQRQADALEGMME